MYLQRNGIFVENSSEGLSRKKDIRIVCKSTGEGGGHIGTSYTYYNVKEICIVGGTSMTGLEKCNKMTMLKNHHIFIPRFVKTILHIALVCNVDFRSNGCSNGDVWLWTIGLLVQWDMYLTRGFGIMGKPPTMQCRS